MEITYIFHSGFAFEADDCVLIFDYYRDTAVSGGYVHGLLSESKKPIYVFASHYHGDHFNTEILRWKEQRSDMQYIFSEDIRQAGAASSDSAVFLDKGGEWADGCISTRAFGSTDIGVSFLVTVAGTTVFHAGDLNNWHWREEVSEQEAVGYEADFLRELSCISSDVPSVGIAMFPVDPRLGKDYMLGGQQFLSAVKTGLFIPMHFGEDYAKAAAFAPHAKAGGAGFFNITKKGESMKW